jgi:site-specific DNA-methyltransferase (adenine-specific)
MSHYLSIFNDNNKYSLKYYSESFLDDDFDPLTLWNIEFFDLVIGNPPYQIGINSRSSISIYHEFVEKSVKISNKVLMVTPSKWYTNPSMKVFRENMINNYGMKFLVDKGDYFKNVDIKGGVSFFLLEKHYKGECLYNNEYRTFSNNLITNKEDMIIIDKLSNLPCFNTYLNSDQYFNIRNIDDRFLNDKVDNCVTCYVSKKNGTIKYIKKNTLKITKNHMKYKVFLPTASGSKNNIGIIGRVVIGSPSDVSSRSFVHFAFDTYFECESFVSYLNTELVKKLIKIKKPTQLMKKDCFSLVPIVPLDRLWNNNNLKEYLKI